MINPDRLAELEYEALQQEKRDKMGSRLQVWGLFISLVGASGVVAGIGSGEVAYAVTLYPLLAACIARYAGHSESVLNQVKAYLLQVEKQAGYNGYEYFNKNNGSGRRGIGGHMQALRDALVITDALAVAVVVWRLVRDGWPWYVAVGLGLPAFLVIIWVTIRWLNNGRESVMKSPA